MKNLPLRTLLSFLLLAAGRTASFGQQPQDSNPKMLLTDLAIQIESTDAVNQMYNFKFDKAQLKFKELRNRYPQHPLPYFLLGLNEWWKMVPNPSNAVHDDTFLSYMDSSITFAEKLFDEDNNNLEAAFFLSAANGLKGEFYGTKKMYTKAAWSTKNALSYLKETSDKDELSPEFLYGNAILNYYRPWLREQYPLLTPILVFFPAGDKSLGIKQLKEVTYNAFYSRTEAQYQLLRIYDNEDDYLKAYPIAKYLANTYPDNAYFQRQYAKFAWFNHKDEEAKVTCQDILHKYEKNYPGFEETSGRYAAYILGDIYRKREMIDSAAVCFRTSINYAERAGQTDQGYYFYSLNSLAEIHEDKGDYKTAEQYYSTLEKCGGKKKYKKKYSIAKDAKSNAKDMKKKARKAENAK